MLHVAALRDRSGSYYLNDLGGSSGRWAGRGAAGLGLAGLVGAEDLAAVLAGRPRGHSLVSRRGSVSGYDLVFTAPKSVSVLLALGPPDVVGAVSQAHDDAWRAALGYVGRQAAAVRRGSGPGRRVLPVDGLVAAAFTHLDSRAGDPHLHTHVVVANLGHGPDGRWTALDGRGLFAHSAAAGALYGSQLRHDLSVGLGAHWRRTRSGRPEVAGVDPVAVGGFSARSAEIREALAAGRWSSARARRVAWAATRDPKTHGAGSRRAGWAARAERLGLEQVEREQLELAPARGRVVGRSVVDEYRYAAALAARDREPRRRDVVTAWADAVLPGAPVTQVLDCVDAVLGEADLVGGRPAGRPGPEVPGARGAREVPKAPASLGVAELPLDLRRVVPAPHLLAELGPRPADPRRLALWQQGARAVSAYRERWGVTGRSALGDVDDGRLCRFPARRLADHLETRRCIEDTCRRLGRPLLRATEVPERGIGRD